MDVQDARDDVFDLKAQCRQLAFKTLNMWLARTIEESSWCSSGVSRPSLDGNDGSDSRQGLVGGNEPEGFHLALSKKQTIKRIVMG
jgi:hypothetical protein